MRGRDGEQMSQGNGEDPEGQGGPDGSGDQCRGGDPEGYVETELQRAKVEPK